VKYYVLLPSVGMVGSSLDNAQWETVLRSLAGERAYRWLNAGTIDSRGIAEFLILDGRFPRSLAFCFDKLTSNMKHLVREYRQDSQAHGMLRDFEARLASLDIQQIFEYGLHEFIQDVIGEIRRLSNAIARDYRFTV
jgi:uncharacterized alpha-E superfamily protein